jgi:hypothetical protein
MEGYKVSWDVGEGEIASFAFSQAGMAYEFACDTVFAGEMIIMQIEERPHGVMIAARIDDDMRFIHITNGKAHDLILHMALYLR